MDLVGPSRWGERVAEKKKSDASAESSRANIGIAISLVALLISIITFVYPIWVANAARTDVVERYLTALVGSERSAYVARGMAAEGSQADQFAQTTGVLWEAVADAGIDAGSLDTGSVTSARDGSYEVCFPGLAIFRAECSVYADFEFSERDRLARFTIDGQPVEQLFRSYEYDKTLTSVDGSNQMRAYSAGRFWDSDSKEKVILLWIDRGANVSTAGRDDLTMSSVTAQDGEEKEVPIISSVFPESVSYYDAYYAAVRVPDEARFLYVCWSGVPQGESPCDWVYSIR